MILLKAIIRPNKVDAVTAALAQLGAGGITVTEVRGHGKQKGHAAIYRGREYTSDLLPKAELEVVVPDSLADQAVQSIINAARTGEVGDGRVFAFPVAQSFHIRLGGLSID
jgi:nitrogen regulatory protein PII